MWGKTLPCFTERFTVTSQNTVLLSPNGHIQLLGFGSKVYDHADVVTEFTSKSDVAFLAPELLDDSSEKSVELPSFASDVWAFGCVCVEVSMQDLV